MGKVRLIIAQSGARSGEFCGKLLCRKCFRPETKSRNGVLFGCVPSGNMKMGGQDANVEIAIKDGFLGRKRQGRKRGPFCFSESEKTKGGSMGRGEDFANWEERSTGIFQGGSKICTRVFKR